MDEYEKIRQKKREAYRKRHRAQVRRKQLITDAVVIGMIIILILNYSRQYKRAQNLP